ncbi:MAG: hypothetical protein KatS3mg082_0552 [Nitrospiraceae bacterium]|nr:MAG: hypothetical protein KatS3mg082_0552 [Nitrospiraceae bacterium]
MTRPPVPAIGPTEGGSQKLDAHSWLRRGDRRATRPRGRVEYSHNPVQEIGGDTLAQFVQQTFDACAGKMGHYLLDLGHGTPVGKNVLEVTEQKRLVGFPGRALACAYTHQACRGTGKSAAKAGSARLGPGRPAR